LSFETEGDNDETVVKWLLCQTKEIIYVYMKKVNYKKTEAI